MKNVLVCEGAMVEATYNGTPLGVFTCSTGWTAQPATDFQGLVDLLTFDPEICAQLIGGCAVLFVFGYSAGFVARMLTRR
jgi:hypothetical protein